MQRRPTLAALADRAGILPGYIDARQQRRITTDTTREALLTSMGFDASSEAAAVRAIASLDDEDTQLLATAAAVPAHSPRVTLRLPPVSAQVAWSLEIVDEDRVRRRIEGGTRIARGQRRIDVPLEYGPPPGYHDVHATLHLGEREWSARQTLIVSPGSCTPLADHVSGRRFGISANLYALRGDDDWGMGDTSQLDALIDHAAAAGAVFAGVNPLHALRNRSEWISPYSPGSRLFRNYPYIDVMRVPELAHSSAAREHIASTTFTSERGRLHDGNGIRYEEVARLKRAILEMLYAAFLDRADEAGVQRRRDFERWCGQQGDALADFATFMALEDRFIAVDPTLDDFRRWPTAFRDRNSPAVAEFRAADSRVVDFHRWLQFELDRQIAGSAARAKTAGLSIGLFGDLAIGSAAGGADQWSFPRLFVGDASLGAPPDDYSATGQDWGLPPIDPHRLARDGFRYWRLLVRNALAHFGMLRIDHVMGLFRQFWIPAGRTGNEGAYVRFPADALLAILAIESRRANAVIVGEDLGTVPRGLPAILARRGILSTRVLYFERERNGAFRASRRYSRRAVVAATTHDQAPLAGFWSGRDIELRRSIGVLDDAEAKQAHEQRERDRHALVARLAAERILPPGARPGNVELRTAVHRFLAHTPSPLLAVSFDDLAGEHEPINVPGVPVARYPSWTRRSRATVDRIAADADAMRALSGVRSRVRRRG